MGRPGIAAFVAAAAAAAIVIVPVIVAEQAPEGWTVPRTADGRPDLNGIWASNSATPFQRPEELGDRTTLTDEEVAAIREHATTTASAGGDAVFGDSPFLRGLASLKEPKENRPSAPPAPKRKLLPVGTHSGGYGQQWMGNRTFDNRTSIVVDPPNGRLPPRTAEAEERAKQQREARNAPPPAEQTVSQELDRLDRGVRCRGGSPLLSGRGYNSNYQIFQTDEYVGIQIEMHHETRLIPIGDVAPSQVGAPSVMGSSRGHWEGDTLVVETTNLLRGSNGSTPDVRVTERFSRVGPEQLQYDYTLGDPSTWTRTWTARIFLRPAPGTGAIYEYACHEGNYAAELSLRSTRAAEARQE